MIVRKSSGGVRYAVQKSGEKVGYCALSINAGTRDEAGFHAGIAHFMEHTLFKGTSRKSSSVINGYLEKSGGELNAYTTKEDIVLHATVLKGNVAKAASLLFEIATDATFPEEEIEIEKSVVIDEIASYKDSPSEDIYDVFEEKLFAGGPLSGLILGTEESVKAISSEELHRFRRKFFTPDRIAFTMVSPLEEEKMAAIAEKLIAGYGLDDFGASRTVPRQSQASPAARFNEVYDKHDNEVNCIIGGTAPSFSCEKDRLTLVLLSNLLGGPASNSLLGAELREKNGWVYNVECNYTPYADSGIVTISFGCDKENLDKCEKTIRKRLRSIQEKPLSRRKLESAKRQLLGQNTIGMESGEVQCLSMGKSLLTYGRINSDEEIAGKIEAVTAEDIMQAAKVVFSEDRLNRLVYL